MKIFYLISFLSLVSISFFSQEMRASSPDDRILLIKVDSISQFRFEGDRSIPSWVNEALSPLLCGQEVYFSTVIAGGEQLKNVKINAFLDEFCVSHKEILLRPSIYLVELEKQLDGLWLKNLVR